MAYSIRSTRGLTRFVSDLYVTIPAYPWAIRGSFGQEDQSPDEGEVSG